jgi:hypothetical protein
VPSIPGRQSRLLEGQELGKYSNPGTPGTLGEARLEKIATRSGVLLHRWRFRSTIALTEVSAEISHLVSL